MLTSDSYGHFDEKTGLGHETTIHYHTDPVIPFHQNDVVEICCNDKNLGKQMTVTEAVLVGFPEYEPFYKLKSKDDTITWLYYHHQLALIQEKGEESGLFSHHRPTPPT